MGQDIFDGLVGEHQTNLSLYLALQCKIYDTNFDAPDAYSVSTILCLFGDDSAENLVI